MSVRKSKREEPESASGPHDLRRITKQLPVALTEAEMVKLGQELAHETVEIDAKYAHKSEVAKEINALIEAHENEVKRLSALINAKAERRDVECLMRYDFTAMTVITTRLDTDEVIEERGMTDAEKQRGLYAHSDEELNKFLAEQREKEASGEGTDEDAPEDPTPEV